MGYTTSFYGTVAITPPLNAEEIAFIKKHNETRRMKRTKGAYFVDSTDNYGQNKEDDIIDYNAAPEKDLSLWCGWTCNDEGTVIEWDGGEKFYSAAEWMKFIIDHFLGDSPFAKKELPFLQGHTLNGEIKAAGEEHDDRWKLIVKANKVTIARGVDAYLDEEDV